MDTTVPGPSGPSGPSVATGRRDDGTLRFTLLLVVAAAPVAAVVSVTGSHLLAVVAGGIVGIWLVLGFPSRTTTRVMAVAVALAPDTVTVAQLGGSPVTLRSLAFGLLAVATLTALVRGRLTLRVPSPLLLTAFALVGLLGALANDRPKSLLEFALLLIVPPVVGATLTTDESVTRDFLSGLCAAMLLLCVAALLEALLDRNFFTTQAALATLQREGRVRANAGWGYPTELSAFLCLGAFFVVQYFRERWRFIGMGIGGALVTSAVIATQSRSGLLGLAAGALTYVLLQRRLGQAIRALAGLGAVIGVLLVLPGAAPSSFRSYAEQSLTKGSSANANITYRQELYQAAGHAMAHKPWLGFGYGSGKNVAGSQLAQYFGTLTDLASLPVSLAVQLGYLGAAALALFVLAAVARAVTTPSTTHRLPLVAGIVGCVVAMLGTPVSPPLFWTLILAGMTWQLAKTARRTARSEHDPQTPTAARPPLATWGAATWGAAT